MLYSSAKADDEENHRATAAGNRAYVASVAANAEGRLDAVSERLAAAGASVAAADADGVDPQVTAASLLDASSMVVAVCFPAEGELLCETFNGTVTHELVSLDHPGLQVIERGGLSGTLAYASLKPNSLTLGSILVIDRDLLEVRLRRNLPLDVELYGVPGGAELDALPITATDLGGGLAVDELSGRITATRTKSLLGHNVAVRTIAMPDQLVVDVHLATGVLLVGGIGLTLSVALLAMFGGRSLMRAIGERDEADAERDQAAQRFRTSFTNAPIGVVEVDEEGRVAAVNPRFASQLGYNVEELDGVDLLELIDGEDRSAARVRMQNLLNGDRFADQSERRYRERSGAAVWVRESASVLELSDGRRHVLIQAEDVSDERRSRAELHRKALFDELTGLPNRANLTARLSRAIESERGTQSYMAVLFVDLDKFKEVNDTHGHEAGDQLLVEVAARLRRACRSRDAVARLGGDEFVVICEGLESEADAETCAERFAAALAVPMVVGEIELPVQASIGLSVTSGEASPEQVLRDADQAMYQAKATGRNRLVRFEGVDEARRPSLPSSTECTEDEVNAALAAESFVLHYQPVFDVVDTTKIVGVEALVRLDHPTRGLLMPLDFLRVAERAGTVCEIDRLVVEAGLAALSRWTNSDPAAADWFMSFNLSPANFERREFADELLGAVAESDVSARQIVLERAETGFMGQPPVAVCVTRQLREAGMRVAVDHFGSGAVSLAEVSTLEFDMLKVDRSFVRSPSTRQQQVLSAIAQMADALDLVAMVEGVETSSELAAIRRAGIPLAQGFQLCRPLDDQGVAMQFLALSV